MKMSVLSRLGCLGVVTSVTTARALEPVEPPPLTESSFLRSGFGLNGLTFGVKASASFPELALEDASSGGRKLGGPNGAQTAGLEFDLAATAQLFPQSTTERAVGTAAARYVVGDASHPDTFRFTFSGDLKTLTSPPPDLMASSAAVNLTFSLSGRVSGVGDGQPDTHLWLPLPGLSLGAMPPGASQTASGFIKIYDKDSNLTDTIDLATVQSLNGHYDLHLDAGQVFLYETTYQMHIEDRVDPPFNFSLVGSVGAFVPAPPPVPVPEAGTYSVAVMGALASGLLWRRRTQVRRAG